VSELAEIKSEQVGSVCLVRVRGEIDMSNASALSARIENAMPAGTPTLVLELSGTTYLDSRGVALLLRLGERLRGRRQELRLVVPPEAPIRAVLDFTGVPAVMRVNDRLDDAFANDPSRSGSA
jgi:anti-anti-sigma factor